MLFIDYYKYINKYMHIFTYIMKNFYILIQLQLIEKALFTTGLLTNQYR